MTHRRWVLELALLGAVLVVAPTVRAGEPGALSDGIALFENMQDDDAAAAFRKLLASRPSRSVAAKAHLYLGLIAFNGNSPDAAANEFKLALKANPAIELPPASSPKARMLLREARTELAAEQESSPVPSATRPVAAEAPLPAAPVASVEAAPEPSHPRVAAIVLGIAGVLVGAAAIYGAVDVADYQGLVSQANQKPGTVAGSQIVSAHGQAQFFATAWIPLAVVAGGCFVGTGFTW